jgi:hypothetical protein
MSKNITIEHSTREQIAEFLPEAIRLAVSSYRQFMMTEEDLDENANIKKREFATHHKEAKIAISHIELLIKLAKWADLPDTTVIGDAEAIYLQGLMRKAEAEIDAYEEDTDIS